MLIVAGPVPQALQDMKQIIIGRQMEKDRIKPKVEVLNFLIRNYHHQKKAKVETINQKWNNATFENGHHFQRRDLLEAHLY